MFSIDRDTATFAGVLTLAEGEGLIEIGPLDEMESADRMWGSIGKAEAKWGFRLTQAGAELSEKSGYDPMDPDSLGKFLMIFAASIQAEVEKGGERMSKEWEALFPHLPHLMDNLDVTNV